MQIMKGRILYTLLSFATLFTYGQQSATISDYLPIDRYNNGDLLFNQLAVNPAWGSDSILIQGRAQLQEQWIGFSESPVEQNFTISGHIPGTMHRAGIEVEWWGNRSIRNRLVRFNYRYLYVIDSRQSIIGGVNLDLASLKMDEIHGLVLADSSQSFFTPNLHLGVQYRYNRWTLGAAYGGLFKNELEGERYNYLVSERSLLLNYSSWTRIGAIFRFSSDVVLATNFEKLSYFIATRFTWKDMITGGVFYNSYNKSKGLLFSGLFFDHFEIGYQFYFNAIEDQLLGGHSVFLGYRLYSE